MVDSSFLDCTKCTFSTQVRISLVTYLPFVCFLESIAPSWIHARSVQHHVLRMSTFTMKNSSCSFNAKSSCCIGGRPPSPDGEAPRQLESLQLRVPTERPKLSGRLFSKHHVPTWRTVEGTELQAIFENEVDDEVDRFRDARHKGST